MQVNLQTARRAQLFAPEAGSSFGQCASRGNVLQLMRVFGKNLFLEKCFLEQLLISAYLALHAST